MARKSDIELLARDWARVRIQIVGGDYEDYPARPPGIGRCRLDPEDVRAILHHLADGDDEEGAHTFIDRFARRYGMSAIWVEDVLGLTIEPARQEALRGGVSHAKRRHALTKSPTKSSRLQRSAATHETGAAKNAQLRGTANRRRRMRP